MTQPEKCCERCIYSMNYIEQIGTKNPTEGKVSTCRNEFCHCHTTPKQTEKKDILFHHETNGVKLYEQKAAPTQSSGIEEVVAEFERLVDFITNDSVEMKRAAKWLRTTLTSFETSIRTEEREKCTLEVQSYREHLRFVWRWISRLNGDKPHDTPEKQWKDYVSCLVHYPSSPHNTGDWFEDETSPHQTIQEIRAQERTRIADLIEGEVTELFAYTEHERNCIRSQFSAGRPTKDGGYEQKFNDKWYRTTPVDKTPKCDCGLEDLSATILNLIRENKQQSV